MAKTKVFTYKIEVDGQEVEQTIDTLNGFDARLGDLYKKLNNTPINTKEWKAINEEIKRTQPAFDAAKNSGKGFVDQLAGMPGIFGTVGQSIKGAGQFFGNFNMIMKASPIGLIATLAVKLIQKFSQMEGVMDPLNKIATIFSGTMGRLANAVLTPLTFVLDKVAAGFEGLMNFFSGAADTGDSLGYVADEMDKLEDSAAAFELQQAKSNRALAEAREIAADSTLPVEERIKALKDAENLERQIAKEGRERALAKARAQAIELATELGLSAEKIKALKTANAQEIEDFGKTVTDLKGLNREKLNALYGTVGEIEQISAGESKIATKTQKQIAAITNQANADAAAKAKERRQTQKENLDAEIKQLLTFQNDNLEKDATYYKNIEAKLREFYKKKNALEDQDKKLTKTQLENRRTEQNEAIKKGLQTLMDANDKTKKLNEDVKTSEENLVKSKKKTTTDQILLVQQQQTELEVAFQKENARLEKDLLLKKTVYGEDSEEYKNALIAKNNAEAAFNTKSQENNTKLEDLVKQRNERLKNLDQVYEQERTDGLKDGLEKQLKIIQEGEKKKLEEYKKGLAEAVKNGDLTLMQALIKYAQFAKIVGEKTKEATKAAIGDDFVKNILQGVDDAVSGTTTSFLGVFSQIDQAKEKLDKGLKDGTLSLTQYQAGIAELNNDLNAQFDKMSVALNAVGAAASAAAQAFGEESAAGRVLVKVSQAIALAETGVALAKSLAGLGEAIKMKFPANVAAVAGTLALIATAFGQAKALFKRQVQESESTTEVRKLASGGLVSGPGTGTSDSIPTMLSNGESVINAQSTAMFTPLLSAINQAGGGRPFQFGGVVSSQDLVSQEQSNTLLQAMGQGQGEPLKAYVVAQDMTSMQMFDRAQKSRSTI